MTLVIDERVIRLGKEKIKVYLYTRVSTLMQIDGYSLDAQKTKMKAFCDYNGYEIAGEYEDAGRSGKSIEGREAFNRMMDDIRSGKDGVSFVLVFKLSRFGRNAADVLSALQVMQDYGVNLICVEDEIDSSKDAGKLMISVLSAVAEIERENIRVQTMTDDAVKHIAKFASGIWQIHPFSEGNTRSTAVFIIKYLKTFGFSVNNEIFAENSWYFRNSLARANYNDLGKGISATTIYLERFSKIFYWDIRMN